MYKKTYNLFEHIHFKIVKFLTSEEFSLFMHIDTFFGFITFCGVHEKVFSFFTPLFSEKVTLSSTTFSHPGKFGRIVTFLALFPML